MLLFTKALHRLRTSHPVRQILQPLINARQKSALRRSPFVDTRFYAAQLGLEEISKSDALKHFTESGASAGFSLIPLFDPQWYGDQIGCSPEVATIAFLRGHPATVSISPFFDTAACIKMLGLPSKTKPVDALLEFRRLSNEVTRVPATDLILHAPSAREAYAQQVRAGRQLKEQSPRPLDSYDLEPSTTPSRSKSVRVILSASEGDSNITETIQSVLNQTHENVSLTVLCPIDSNQRIPIDSHFAELRDPRVELLRIADGTLLEEQNRALQSATEDFLLFLESPWQLTRDFLQSAVSVATANNLEFVAGSAELLPFRDSRGRTIQPMGYDELLKTSSGLVQSSYLFSLEHLRDSLTVEIIADLNAGYLRLLEVSKHSRGGSIALPAVSARDEVPKPTGASTKGDMIALSAHRIDWTLLQAQAHDRIPNLVSVLMPVFEDYRYTCGAVKAVLDHTDGHPIEIIVVNNSQSPKIQKFLDECLLSDPRVTVIDEPQNSNFALGTNLAFAMSSGARIVCLNNDTVVQAGWLSPLLREIEKEGVRIAQSLLLYPDRRIQTAGTVCFGARIQPQHFLVDHAESEGSVVKDLDFHVVSAASVALSASTFAQARGFDTSYVNGFEDVDLCLRLSEDKPRARVVPESVVIHFESRSKGRNRFADENRRTFFGKWRSKLPSDSEEIYRGAGMVVVGFQPGPFFPKATHRDSRAILASAARGDVDAEALRWSIKVASPSGRKGELWGDTIFAERLADSLRALGQIVSIDRREHHMGPSDMTEDVVLSLRGLDLVPPNPLAVNVLWVISHPDLVKATELHAYDLRFAASETWSRKMSTPQYPVEPLFQATSHIFSEAAVLASPERQVVFVGSTRGVQRPAVLAAVRAGVPLRVYGPGWEGIIDDRFICGEYVSPEALSSLYQSSSFVLNDHWPDMQSEGFISNRVFDAVASGARVISDPVEGLERIFGRAVQTWSSSDDIAALVASPARFGSAEELRETAQRVSKEHSFDSRALTLLAAVQQQRRISQKI